MNTIEIGNLTGEFFPLAAITCVTVPADKVLHFCVAGVAVGVLGAWGTCVRRLHCPLFAALVLVVLGAGFWECLDAYIPANESSWADWGASCLGAASSYALLFHLYLARV